MREERKAVSILSEITSAQTDAEQRQGCEVLEDLPGCESSVNGFNTSEAVELWIKASVKTKSVIRLVWLYQKGVLLAGREGEHCAQIVTPAARIIVFCKLHYGSVH